jgi:hypothetical protein
MSQKPSAPPGNKSKHPPQKLSKKEPVTEVPTTQVEDPDGPIEDPPGDGGTRPGDLDPV